MVTCRSCLRCYDLTAMRRQELAYGVARAPVWQQPCIPEYNEPLYVHAEDAFIDGVLTHQGCGLDDFSHGMATSSHAFVPMHSCRDGEPRLAIVDIDSGRVVAVEALPEAAPFPSSVGRVSHPLLVPGTSRLIVPGIKTLHTMQVVPGEDMDVSTDADAVVREDVAVAGAGAGAGADACAAQTLHELAASARRRSRVASLEAAEARVQRPRTEAAPDRSGEGGTCSGGAADASGSVVADPHRPAAASSPTLLLAALPPTHADPGVPALSSLSPLPRGGAEANGVAVAAVAWSPAPAAVSVPAALQRSDGSAEALSRTGDAAWCRLSSLSRPDTRGGSAMHHAGPDGPTTEASLHVSVVARDDTTSDAEGTAAAAAAAAAGAHVAGPMDTRQDLRSREDVAACVAGAREAPLHADSVPRLRDAEAAGREDARTDACPAGHGDDRGHDDGRDAPCRGG